MDLDPAVPTSAWSRWMPLALGGLAFAAFGLGAAPGPYWLDSQEIGAAAVRLGVPHPTGFPLVCFLGRLAALVPLGELAFRVHLLSALAAAVAVALVVRLVLELGRDPSTRVGAAAAGLLLAGSTTFLRQATVTEVYAPTAALLAATLLLLPRAGRPGAAGRTAGLSLALLAGLGVGGLHVSYALLLGAPLCAVLAWRLRHGARWVLATPALLALGAVGATVYLPIRSATGRVAALDWGHPATVGALLDHLRAARIRRAFGDEMFARAPEVLGEHARSLARILEGDLGVIALLTAAAGLAALARRRGDRLTAASLAIVAVGDLAYAVLLHPMGIAERQNGVLFAVAAAALAGVGIAAAGRRFGRAAPFAAAVVGFVAFVPAVLGAWSEKGAVARSEAPRRWSEAALGACPPRSIALVVTDSTAAGLLWLTAVEGARPDVAVLVRQHLWDVHRDRAVLGAVGLAVHPRGAEEALAAVRAVGRPICWEPGIDPPPRGTRLRPFAALGVLEEVDGAGDPRGAFARARGRLARVFADPAAADAVARRTHANALDGLGRAWMAASEDPTVAGELLRGARDVEPRSPSPRINLGVLAARAGDLGAAAAETERALALAPNHPTALVNAARYRLALGEDAAARRHAERATRVAPRRAAGWALVGVLDARAGRTDLARRHLERALALDPSDEDARVNLARLPAAR